MNVSRHRGADTLVRSLWAAGTRRVFTLSGNHIMPVFDAALDAGIDLIHTRHEAAAVHMADSWARLTGEVGIAPATRGPGHANAVSALYTASMAESPVVLLSGHAPHDELGMGAFQEMRQAEMAAPVTKAAWVCERPDVVGSDFEKAVEIARTGRPGAVHLSLPSDCLEREIGPQAARERQDLAMPLDPNDAMAIFDGLGRSKRPLILAGPASMTRAGRERMAGP